ncbi:receptor-type tyrosine-protein phosphatase epsilon-like [Haliotis rubra]|uniref:receptor-type tyrosine-protein phosphatase epsilon-like n=1 Tax=Haliotis rubra TaxID=36100 RepID=UPI001EE62FE1|nr:receptor-type tyrosine-protein phosphatase epsilon-like [Haliotis rubra]
MVWDQNCTRIVMLTDVKEFGRLKCKENWSDTSGMYTGEFNVSVTDCIIRAHWIVRTLQVTDRKTNIKRCFHQFHFATWTSDITPEETNLTEFLWLVRTLGNAQHGPLLVHCSDGIGRTGTFIALDYLLDQALDEDAVDVFGYVLGMRGQRKGMVQTKTLNTERKQIPLGEYGQG